MKDRELPVQQHLGELRRRITLSVIVVIAFTVAAFIFNEQLIVLLMEPAKGFEAIPNGKPVFTEPTEYIGVAMKVSLYTAIAASIPFLLYQGVMFVAPGLKPEERRYLYFLLPLSIVAFLAGASFGYIVLFPPMVSFLLSYGGNVAVPLIRVGSYINLMISLLLWMGLIFEMPLVFFFLGKIGIVTYKWMSKQRRYAVLVAFIIGAIVTPTLDPVNQAIVAGPVIVLYELSIWLVWLGTRGRRAKAKQAATTESTDLAVIDKDGLTKRDK
ncbi:MAG: twin-arginine translocase subunit TatC [Chloroflexi bacterium]|nr:twin-arginine translocase subunit TatC [Chloroflexota bacterium]